MANGEEQLKEFDRKEHSLSDKLYSAQQLVSLNSVMSDLFLMFYWMSWVYNSR